MSSVPQRGAPRFVVVFVLLVLLQLIAFRYFVESAANDRYLFHVAQHTTLLLNGLGDGAILEERGMHLEPAEARAIIAQDNGVPTGVHNGEPVRPLSTWERWQYQVRTVRDSPARHEDFGPQVSFILWPSIHQRLREATASRAALVDTGLGNATEVSALDGKIIALQQEIAAGLQDPALRKTQQGAHFSFSVIPACGAIEVMAIFLAAILAFPASWAQKFQGILLGIPILYTLNILRLACLALIGALDRGGAWFTFVHEYVWQAVYVVFVVVLWLLWVELLVRRRTP